MQPLLGKKFGQKDYVLTILRDVEDEVHRSPRLRHNYPWFDAAEMATERLAHSPRLSAEDKQMLNVAAGVLHGLVQMEPDRFMTRGRSPPSHTDCRVLAFGQIRPAIVVTDDLGMHELADMVGMDVWHGPELLKKMLSAKLIGNELVREIYAALEANGDLTGTWVQAKHSIFVKQFGKALD
ncbi:MAG: hypothetical protein V4713_04755 [Pseudomonadota bacterium]